MYLYEKWKWEITNEINASDRTCRIHFNDIVGYQTIHWKFVIFNFLQCGFFYASSNHCFLKMTLTTYHMQNGSHNRNSSDETC